MKKSRDEPEKPRWAAAWRWEDIHPSPQGRPAIIGRLSRGARDELNRRLEKGEGCKALADWLNGLPELKGSMKRPGRRSQITARGVAQWKRGGFRQWRLMAETQSNMARRCLEWAQGPDIQEKIFGPGRSNLEWCNVYRGIWSMTPLRREDFSPEELEFWDYVPTRQERRDALYEVLGREPDDPRESDTEGETQPSDSEFEDDPCATAAENGIYEI